MTYSSLRNRPNLFRSGISQGKTRSGVVASPITFQAFAGDSGNANLPETLTVNSITVSPLYSYKAENASTSTWTATSGPNCPIASTGTLPTVGRNSPVTTATEQSVLFNAGKVYQSSTTSDQIGTEDICWEYLAKSPASGTACFVATQRNNFGSNGWVVGFNNPTTAIAGIGTGTLLSAAVIAGSWNHIMFFVNRDSTTGFQLYINGVLANTGNPTAAAASLNASLPLTLGGQANFAGNSITEQAFFRTWIQSNWFAGGATDDTQFAAVAKERFAKLTGYYASTSANGIFVPTTMTRGSSAYLDRVVSTGPTVRQMFYMGTNWPRLSRRENAATGTFLTGAQQEPAVTNLCLQSETFDNATWTKVAGTVTADALAAPTGDTVADAYIADATTTLHAVAQTITLAATTYIFSCFVKAGDKSMVILEDGTIASGRVWFNLSTGAVGTKQAGITEALIEPWGNGWFRVSAKFTGTAAPHTLAVYCASADNDPTSTGDASTVSTYLYGAQLEQSSEGAPTSYVVATTASAVRIADKVDYNITGSFPAIGAPFAYSLDIMMRNFDQVGDWYPVWIGASSVSSTDVTYVRIAPSSDITQTNMIVGGATQFAMTGGGDIVNGEKHTIKTTVDVNNANLIVDGSNVNSDVSVTMQTLDMVYLRIGADRNGSFMNNAVLSNLSIKNGAS